jgi:hypothetical protein
MENLFLCQVGDLPGEILDEATSTTATFSTPLIYHDQLIGSGTFVDINGRKGIATATHVASLINFDPAFDEKLRLCIADFAHDFQIPVRHALHHAVAAAKCEEFGPDLSFIELLGKPDIDAIVARKSFYSLTHRSEEKLKGAEHDRGIWLITGNPDEMAHEDEPTGDFNQVIALPGIGACSGVEARHEKYGFDYLDVSVQYSGKSAPPQSFGGCSGGGLWRFELSIDNKSVDQKIKCDGFYLSGVAFYQTEVRDSHRSVRCHGPRSIYAHLVQRVDG